MTLTIPATSTSTVLVPPTPELLAYRAVAQQPVQASFDTSDQPPVPSPVYPFVLAHRALVETVSSLIRADEQPGPDEPRDHRQGPAVVHLSQVITLHRPPWAGEELAVDVEPLGARTHRGGVQMAIRSMLRDAPDHPVATLDTGLLLVGASHPAPFGEVAPYSARRTDTAPVVVIRRTPIDIARRYADVSGDHNAIHLQPEAARAAGFADVVLHGMCVLAIVAEEVIARYAGGDAARVRSLGARFSTPVSPGDAVEIQLRPSPDRTLVGVSCRTELGPALKSGWVELMF